MKILVVGDWHSDLHEEEMMRALVRLGHCVDGFKWCSYFSHHDSCASSVYGIIKRIQNKFIIGPLVTKLNDDLLKKSLEFSPDVVFIYRGTHVKSSVLRDIKKRLPRCILVGYNNDDPFSPNQPGYLWRHFKQCIPEYHMVLAYRHSNIDQLRSAGANRVELLRSWFVQGRNYPLSLSDEYLDKYQADVVFIGHYEPDQRVEYLEKIVQAGYTLHLFGPSKYWQASLEKSPLLKHLLPVNVVWGEEYNRALCSAKIALCFFSKLNRDTYTRRCFEIPATRTLLLSEYSDDLATLYEEGKEADFFRDSDEMLRKINDYITNDPLRMKVANNGYMRVHSDGHDIDSRMRKLIMWISEIRENL